MLLRRMSLRKSEDPDAFRGAGSCSSGAGGAAHERRRRPRRRRRRSTPARLGQLPPAYNDRRVHGDAADVLQALQALKDRGLVR
jgi:hypothetical protein